MSMSRVMVRHPVPSVRAKHPDHVYSVVEGRRAEPTSAEAAAAMSEALLRANPAATVVATTREPLNIDGERVYPVPPLAVPVAAAEGQSDPLQYPAIRLFFETAKAASIHFNPDRRDVATIGTICRRLGGLPLAIELAAARAAVLGINEVAAQLDDPLGVLGGGRRTAPPRHRSMRAVLDWS
jgi:predicted ATPase